MALSTRIHVLASAKCSVATLLGHGAPAGGPDAASIAEPKPNDTQQWSELHEYPSGRGKPGGGLDGPVPNAMEPIAGPTTKAHVKKPGPIPVNLPISDLTEYGFIREKAWNR